MNNWFNNIGFSWKLRIPLALIAALMLVIVAISYINVNRMTKEAEAVMDGYLPATEFLLEADRDLYQALLAERMLVLAPPGSVNQEQLIQTIEENLGQAETRVGKYADIMAEREITQKTEQFLEYFRARQSTVRNIISLMESDQPQAADLSINKASEEFDAMRGVIDELTEVTHQYSSLKREHAETQKNAAVFQLSALLIFGILSVAFLWFVLPRFALIRLNQLLERITDMAEGEGDLTQRLQASSKDEFGQISTEFNKFIGKLQESIKGILNTSGELSESTNIIKDASARTSDTLDNQRQEISMAAAAINEMGATIAEVARNTTGAAEKAKQAESCAGEGQSIVQAMVSGIEGLANDIQSSANAIQNLKENTVNVGAVLDVIRGIAEQTNLLALNAAIEAARAGEQGRGFAVVADEVRTLAQRTQESTQEIRDVIEQLQVGADQAVDQMGSSQEKVSASVTTALKAGASLNSITEAVKQIVDLNVQIAAAAEEQSTATEEINRNMNNITYQTDETAESAKTSASTAEIIFQHTNTLNSTLNRFKV
ncbi:methyl-accepting chemotaxis protein [Teredinibacter haidensis]|uniref:methyl-accepting chemotaxis protein n=1 Tax=Teredinibacter haidensis TaxID=2731755 RepID=UPI000948D07E|nr:methyl-accepting chemotaxis protein [Teredinibacter haidensis]